MSFGFRYRDERRVYRVGEHIDEQEYYECHRNVATKVGRHDHSYQ